MKDRKREEIGSVTRKRKGKNCNFFFHKKNYFLENSSRDMCICGKNNNVFAQRRRKRHKKRARKKFLLLRLTSHWERSNFIS